MSRDAFLIAGREFRSRLIVGTGKYKSGQETARAIEASGAEMVTVAVRRVNLDRSKESLLDFIDPGRYFLLPNTAGCYTAEDAIRTARLGREVGLSDWVKVEVIGDERTLYPDVQATIEATRVLAKEGFTVLPYTNDDVVAAKRLLDAGASAIMPLGAPIGSGMGIQNSANLRILREMISGVPLIVDAGVGTASDAAIAMELGADGVLMNSVIALVPLQVLRILHVPHFLVLVIHEDELLAVLGALLGALGRFRISALGAALFIAHPAAQRHQLGRRFLGGVSFLGSIGLAHLIVLHGVLRQSQHRTSQHQRAQIQKYF